MATEIFQDITAPSNAVLSSPIDAIMTSITVSALINLPVLQSGQQTRLSLRDNYTAAIERVIAVGPSDGLVYNIIRGADGSQAITHVAGASVIPVLSAELFDTVYPKGQTVVVNGTISWPDHTIKELWVNQSAPMNPAIIDVDITQLVPYQNYRVIDGTLNAGTYPITITASSGESKEIQQSGDSLYFSTNGINLRFS